jgi:hypothetical protein
MCTSLLPIIRIWALLGKIMLYVVAVVDDASVGRLASVWTSLYCSFTPPTTPCVTSRPMAALVVAVYDDLDDSSVPRAILQ